ncbi:MAG: DUF1698 domain-containing protein [Thermoleophilia bacterium]|nr:DUF1698 domain-containing protein [Thermoleophilia bacterium]
MAELTTPAEASAFLARSSVPWHQRFQLAPGVYTPGVNDTDLLLGLAGVPADLSGLTVLDIGTSNGGVAFEAERRGAARVLAVDVTPMEYCGFDETRELLGARAEFLQASVYELPELLDEQFDLVLLLGVLYHLRHPLLALDALRHVVGGELVIETAVCDADVGRHAVGRPLVRFYPGAELDGDPTNWFAPTLRALLDWCESSGFAPTVLAQWPPGRVLRRLLRAGGPRWWAAARRARGAARRCVVRAVPTGSRPGWAEKSWAEWDLVVESRQIAAERRTSSSSGASR